ncbi:hypothetical protein LEP1GSC163_0189 [Leptospira santarosai str. CBC379]|uniref:hypothetical protein n=1 Tax=Leptospira santarosai TaxID=28183 RepID=UPI00029821BA|nr:hypothetical protein [Leptospira santarosai]EKR89707.1 hypothetical protein LEP1GSC163_0189 [Leptospira santarosai str. CBC379]
MRVLLLSLVLFSIAVFGQDTDPDAETDIIFCKTNASESKGILQIQIELPEKDLNSYTDLFLETDAGTFHSKNRIFKVPLTKLLERRRRNLVANFWLVAIGTNICKVVLDLNDVRSKLISNHLKSIDSKKINLRDFEYISNGMDFEEVASYFGHPGEEVAYYFEYPGEEILKSEDIEDDFIFGRAWKNADGSQLIVLFMRNQVFSKNHVGLK